MLFHISLLSLPVLQFIDRLDISRATHIKYFSLHLSILKILSIALAEDETFLDTEF